MVQWVRNLAVKLNDLNLSPGTYTVKGSNSLDLPADLYTHAVAMCPPPIQDILKDKMSFKDLVLKTECKGSQS